ncbi:MAG: SDR family NAD(P)-dependent oxidoreductase [Actinomycetota bacterium]|nr:SDR family NAD(P)-dependent oxidoreductase [Actinomycetota bacterium]
MTEQAVVVTGASTGIGHAVAKRLANNGWQVWAGTRSRTDAVELERHPGVSSLRIEVTDESSLKTAFDEVAVQRGSAGLDLLVVNAGIVVGGPLEYVSQAEWRQQLDVNVVGVALSIRHALPLLRASGRSRIIVVGSINSRVGLPLLSPYVASKHALVGLVSSLRQELGRDGPRITLVEPGAVQTPLWEKVERSSDDIYQRLPAEGLDEYGRFLEQVIAKTPQNRRGGIHPDRVAAVIEKCAGRRYPPRRRIVGGDARIAAVLNTLLPGRFFDVLVRRSRSVRISSQVTDG